MRTPALLFAATAVFALSAAASDQIGTITQLEGTVKIFTHPSKKLDAAKDDSASPHALFEGEYFHVQDAKIGDQVELGNILRTAPGAKARVVFNNGDQYNVGPGTAYRVFWSKDSAHAEAKIDLMYGKLRGVVTPGGPRSKLLIRTKSATMGVRGTDFFIASGLSEENGIRSEGTEVAIIRGKVELTPKAVAAEPVKPVKVEAGYSAEVTAPAAPASGDKGQAVKTAETMPRTELRKTTQEDLTAIQKSSEIKTVSQEAPKEIKALEEKAVKAVLADVKAGDAQLFAKLQGKEFKSTDEINHLAVEKLRPDAPKAPEKRKPFKSEMDDLEGGAYEKYFKPATSN